MDLYSRGLHGQLGLYQCHGGGGNQFFAFAKSGEIFTGEEHCLGRKNEAVVSVECSENIQDHLWNYNDKVCMQDLIQFCWQIFKPILFLCKGTMDCTQRKQSLYEK